MRFTAITTLFYLSLATVYGRKKVPFSENPQAYKHSGCLTDCDEQQLPSTTLFYAYNGKLPSDVPHAAGFGEEIWGGYIDTHTEASDRRTYVSMCDGTTVLDYKENSDDSDTIFSRVNDVCLASGRMCVRSKLGSCHSCARFECQDVKWIPNQGGMYDEFFEGNPNTRVF